MFVAGMKNFNILTLAIVYGENHVTFQCYFFHYLLLFVRMNLKIDGVI